MDQNRDSYQWGAYSVMAFMGMAVIIFGVVAETWLYLATYLLWVSATTYFGFITLRMIVERISALVHVLVALLFTAIVLCFLSATLRVAADTIPMYIPLSTNLGILFTIGLCEVWQPLKHYGQAVIVAVAAFVLNSMHTVNDQRAIEHALNPWPQPGYPLDPDIEPGLGIVPGADVDPEEVEHNS